MQKVRWRLGSRPAFAWLRCSDSRAGMLSASATRQARGQGHRMRLPAVYVLHGLKTHAAQQPSCQVSFQAMPCRICCGGIHRGRSSSRKLCKMLKTLTAPAVFAHFRISDHTPLSRSGKTTVIGESDPDHFRLGILHIRSRRAADSGRLLL